MDQNNPQDHGLEKGKIIALIIYVDDMIVTRNDQDEISSLQQYLASEFEMKQLGNLKYVLGIEVARSKHGIFLCQRRYTFDLLSETGLLGGNLMLLFVALLYFFFCIT